MSSSFVEEINLEFLFTNEQPVYIEDLYICEVDILGDQKTYMNMYYNILANNTKKIIEIVKETKFIVNLEIATPDQSGSINNMQSKSINLKTYTSPCDTPTGDMLSSDELPRISKVRFIIPHSISSMSIDQQNESTSLPGCVFSSRK